MSNNKPLVLTYASSETENFQIYRQTLIDNDWEFVVLGLNEEWKGFRQRMETYKNYLLNLEDKERIIVVTDAYDVFCVRNSRNFIEAFQEFKKDMVVSMEIFAEGDLYYWKNRDYYQVTELTKYWKFHKKLNTSFRHYVNAGLIAGKAEEILRFYYWSIQQNYQDDQKALGEYICTFPRNVALDIEAKLLHTTNFLVDAGYHNEYQEQDSPTLSELLGKKNFFLHVPGGQHVFKGQHYGYKLVKSIIENNTQKKFEEGLYAELTENIKNLKHNEFLHFA
jgi:hypothetical protein